MNTNHAHNNPVPYHLSRRQILAGTSGLVAAAAAGSFVQPAMAQDASPPASPIVQPDMTGAVYPFQIGSFSCRAVSDGASISPDFAMFVFAGTPPERVEEILSETGIDVATVENHHTPILIDTGDHLVLVDTGYGPGVSPNDGLLLANMQGEGVSPEDIDVVVLTHGHPDHIGVNLDAEGNLTFPNARYVMSQEDWDFWTDTPRVEQMIPLDWFRELLLSFVERQLVPLDGTIELIGYDEEIVPGITSVAAQGHTPGHMALLVESEDDRLWIAGDLGSPISLAYPDIVGLPDVEPERMIETRMRLFARMAEEGGLVAFYHASPFPGMGNVVSAADVWGWQPVGAGIATPAG